jgi:hypothetical protein
MHGSDSRKHVVPKEDMRPHRNSIDCWCHPKVDDEDPFVIIHNSMDERERYEQGRALS